MKTSVLMPANTDTTNAPATYGPVERMMRSPSSLTRGRLEAGARLYAECLMLGSETRK